MLFIVTVLSFPFRHTYVVDYPELTWHDFHPGVILLFNEVIFNSNSINKCRQIQLASIHFYLQPIFFCLLKFRLLNNNNLKLQLLRVPNCVYRSTNLHLLHDSNACIALILSKWDTSFKTHSWKASYRWFSTHKEHALH